MESAQVIWDTGLGGKVAACAARPAYKAAGTPGGQLSFFKVKRTMEASLDGMRLEMDGIMHQTQA